MLRRDMAQRIGIGSIGRLIKKQLLAWVLAALLISGAALIFYQPPAVQAQGGAVAPLNISISGTGATVQVYPAGGLALSIQYIAPTTNAAAVEVGDATTSATSGCPVAPGGGLFKAPIPVDVRLAPQQHYYNLASQYAYIANGDTLRVVVDR
jgi:hypothetical protein